MSAYIYCPKCGEDSLDVDTLSCDECGYRANSPSSQSDLLAELEALRLYKAEHERLKKELNCILHPNGDGPEAPLFCDLVAYVRRDLKG